MENKNFVFPANYKLGEVKYKSVTYAKNKEGELFYIMKDMNYNNILVTEKEFQDFELDLDSGFQDVIYTKLQVEEGKDLVGEMVITEE